jgi:DNA-binding transcriptional LysR family regulator
MDLEYLTTFLEIAKQGSFSRAGQKLFRSQPAVSAQIRQLEEEYGPKLFDRSDHSHVARSPHTAKKHKAAK